MIVYVGLIESHVVCVRRNLAATLIELEHGSTPKAEINEHGYRVQWTCAFVDGYPQHLRWTATSSTGEKLRVERERVQRGWPMGLVE
jgi:hypothetical protein